MEKLQDRYILKEQLGSGGMASVWLAFDPVLEREVAIKIIQSRFLQDDDFLERFRREAAISANLDHPGIVKVYEQGVDETTPFIVMEYVKGKTLRERMKEGPLSLEESLLITEDILHALRYAHNRGVLHRDIKPQNIILTDKGTKLIDFGVAQIAGASQITTPGEIIGTAEYLAPEISKGEEATAASDLYSLAAVLYEMLTDKTPYPGKSIVEVLAKQAMSDPALPSEEREGLDPYFDHLLFKSLSKERRDRFQSAEEMLLALQEQKREKREKPYLAIILAILFILLSFFVLQDGKKNMSSFIGLTKKEAISLSRTINIKPVFLEQESNAPKGKIFWQGKDPGETLDPGEEVLFYLSKGRKAKSSFMPNLIGEDLKVAENILKRKRVSYRIVFRPGEEGVILATSPLPGQVIKKSVTLFVGDIALPDLVGKSIDEAVRILNALAIDYQINYEESESPEGTVLAQTPDPGTLSDAVTLFVASPSSVNIIPDVLFIPEERAAILLQEEGFSTVVLYEISEELPGTVIRQSPLAGESRKMGTTVRIWIAKP
jgi:serine/threonine protein kinase